MSHRTRSARITSALGRGLVAGAVGTAVMTVSSTLEARLSGRGASSTPGDAVGVVGHLRPADETGEERLNTAGHWGYGAAWGLGRSLLDVVGLRGPVASVIHLGAVLGSEQALLPALGVARPTPAYGATAAATDVLHHAVYAAATGAAYDALARRDASVR